MSRILKLIDTTGVKPQFLLSGKHNYTTSLGGIISLVNLVILTLVIYAFGKNFFERTQPSMIQNIIYPERYPNYTLNRDLNFTYAARLEDFDGNAIERTDLVYIDFIYFHYEIKNGVWVLLEEKTLDYDLCKKSDFEKPELFERQGLKTAFCPNFTNLYVGGGWDETYVKFIRGFIKHCREGNFNNKGQKCGTEREFKEILKNRLFISNYYQEYFVDSDDYLKPMDLVYTVHYYMLDPFIMKKSSYYFRTGTITTDYGWILKNEESYRKFTYDSLVSDSISVSQLPESQQNILGEIFLFFSKKEEKIMRTYTKIQNLAADVGGIVKVFYTINLLIASFFTIHMMNFEMINFILENFDRQDSKHTDLFFSNKNLVNYIKQASPIKSKGNLKTIPKLPKLSEILEKENNTSKLANKEQSVGLHANKLQLDKPSRKSKLSLKEYLKRHLYCKKIYKEKFTFLEDKLVSILDIKNYLIISNELNIIKNNLEKDLSQSINSNSSSNSNSNNISLSKNELFQDAKENNLQNNFLKNQNHVKNNNFIEHEKL